MCTFLCHLAQYLLRYDRCFYYVFLEVFLLAFFSHSFKSTIKKKKKDYFKMDF